MSTRHLRSRRGFTMIELAISILLAAFITAGLFQLFTMQSRQMAFLDMQAEMNQNLRFASDIVTRTLRNAGLGTGGAVTGYLGYGGDNNNELPAVSSHDAHSYGGGTDAVTVVYQDPSLTMNTDISRIASTATDNLAFDMDMHDYATLIQSYEEDEFLLCFDFANQTRLESYLWTISSVDTSSGVIYVDPNTGYTDYTAVAPVDENLTPVMTCSKGQVVTFYIDNDGDDGMGPGSEDHPVLMMDLDYSWPDDDDVPLVDDIEDLQLAWCVEDTDCTLSSTWLDSINTTDTVWMARVSLIARSSREELRDVRRMTRPGLENRSAGTSQDGYFRKAMTTQVTLRNIRYYSNLGFSNPLASSASGT